MILGQQRAPTPQEIQAEALRRRQQTRQLRRWNLEHAVLRGYVCPNPACRMFVVVGGPHAHEWDQGQRSRWIPCPYCGQDEGIPDALGYQNPMSGVCYDEDEWQAFLDSPRR
jgi:hypothetical protein